MCINKNSRFQTKNEYVWTGVNDPKTARVDPNFLEKYKKIFPFSDKKKNTCGQGLSNCHCQ